MSHKIDEEQVAKDIELIKYVSTIDKALKHIKKLIKKPETATLPKKEADPRVTEILKTFAEKYDEVKELPYSINFARDGSLAKKLLVTYSYEGIKDLIDHYLRDMKDLFFADHGYSFPIFVSQINKITYSYNQKLKGDQDGIKTHYR